MGKVLVTGAAGFIGSHFVERLLREQREVIAVDNLCDYYDPKLKLQNIGSWKNHPRVKWLEHDFCHPASCRAWFRQFEIESVVHLGGYPGVRYSVQNPPVYFEVNVGGTLELLEALRGHSIKRLVFASSSTVYGQGAETPFREDAALGTPLSPYGVSKRAAELLLLNYWKMHGVPVVIARLFSVIGPRLRPDLALSIFSERILSGSPMTLFNRGDMLRDFTHVSDICDGLMACLETKGIEGETFNLGHDEPAKISDVLSGLERRLNRRAFVQHAAAPSVEMSATHASLAKSRSVLDYSPRVSLEDALDSYVDWFLASKSGSAVPRHAA